MMDLDDDELIEVSIRLPRAFLRRSIHAIGSPQLERVQLAKSILIGRRRRATALPDIRLGEPNWDMLLDLYVAGAEQLRVDISSICIASGTPQTTALRHIAILVRDGHLIREADDADKRRTFIRISETLFRALDTWLSEQADLQRHPQPESLR
jgi:DNA-binding MarR family transcriptional regulator